MSGIAIVEPNHLVRYGLATVLSQAPHIITANVGAFADLDRDAGQSDLFIVSADPWDEAGLNEVVATLTVHGRVLLLADEAAPRPLQPALRAGAHGWLGRMCEREELLEAVEAVVRGGLYVAAGLAGRLRLEMNAQTEPRPRTHRSAAGLPPRECEALSLLAEGLTHRQIAKSMGVSEHTISTYIKRIRSKLNVGNKADLTRVAIELGLLSAPTGPERHSFDPSPAMWP